MSWIQTSLSHLVYIAILIMHACFSSSYLLYHYYSWICRCTVIEFDIFAVYSRITEFWAVFKTRNNMWAHSIFFAPWLIVVATISGELKDIFKELYPLATYWDTIGALLGIPTHILHKIKCEGERVDERLREMLSEWLKRTDPPPTWTALADAVEIIDKLKAHKLRVHCLEAQEYNHT